ncbi:MAG: hypothetical protein P1U40_08565 [Coxiellaceae bacterium]|nr:hypothetical protein [Coxiellaceae bacterium]
MRRVDPTNQKAVLQQQLNSNLANIEKTTPGLYEGALQHVDTIEQTLRKQQENPADGLGRVSKKRRSSTELAADTGIKLQLDILREQVAYTNSLKIADKAPAVDTEAKRTAAAITKLAQKIGQNLGLIKAFNPKLFDAVTNEMSKIKQRLQRNQYPEFKEADLKIKTLQQALSYTREILMTIPDPDKVTAKTPGLFRCQVAPPRITITRITGVGEKAPTPPPAAATASPTTPPTEADDHNLEQLERDIKALFGDEYDDYDDELAGGLAYPR